MAQDCLQRIGLYKKDNQEMKDIIGRFDEVIFRY
jgi:hypothetical protein